MVCIHLYNSPFPILGSKGRKIEITTFYIFGQLFSDHFTTKSREEESQILYIFPFFRHHLLLFVSRSENPTCFTTFIAF